MRSRIQGAGGARGDAARVAADVHPLGIRCGLTGGTEESGIGRGKPGGTVGRGTRLTAEDVLIACSDGWLQAEGTNEGGIRLGRRRRGAADHGHRLGARLADIAADPKEDALTLWSRWDW